MVIKSNIELTVKPQDNVRYLVPPVCIETCTNKSYLNMVIKALLFKLDNVFDNVLRRP